jgi:hypothetical protein
MGQKDTDLVPKGRHLVKGRGMLSWLNGAIEVGFGNNQRVEHRTERQTCPEYNQHNPIEKEERENNNNSKRRIQQRLE